VKIHMVVCFVLWSHVSWRVAITCSSFGLYKNTSPWGWKHKSSLEL